MSEPRISNYFDKRDDTKTYLIIEYKTSMKQELW
jgi:hypothetical protein